MENLLPEGRYKASLHDFGTGASASKGTPYIRLGLKILEGEHANRIIDAMLWVTDKTMRRVATDLMALGYVSEEEPLVVFGNAKTIAEVLSPPRDVQIVVGHEEFPTGSGRLNARVKYINALSQPAPPASPERKSAWKAAYMAAKAGQGASRAPTPQPIDDMPFLSPQRPVRAPTPLANQGSGASGVMETLLEALAEVALLALVASLIFSWLSNAFGGAEGNRP